MRIFVKAKPKSKKEFVEKITEQEFIISIKEPPIDGRANWAVCRALAEYLGVSPSKVNIISGQGSRNKVIEVK